MTKDLLTALAAGIAATALAVLAALPNASNPAVIPLGGILGGFLAGTVIRLRRRPRRELQDAVIDGAYWGTATAIIAYAIANIAGV